MRWFNELFTYFTSDTNYQDVVNTIENLAILILIIGAVIMFGGVMSKGDDL